MFTILEWYIYCLLRPWTLRLVGIGLAVISVVVIWSEMTFFCTRPVLSIFAQIVNAIRQHHDYFALEVRTRSMSIVVITIRLAYPLHCLAS
jgi:hypothetical protein